MCTAFIYSSSKKCCHSKHKAYTFIELLAALAILLLLSSYALCTIAENRNAEMIVKRESSELSTWLGEHTAFADSSGSTFTLNMINYGNNTSRLRLTWESGPYYAQTEDFIPDKCRLSCSSASESIYSGEWHTLTPAATFTVYRLDGAQTVSKQVSLSGQGYINIK